MTIAEVTVLEKTTAIQTIIFFHQTKTIQTLGARIHSTNPAIREKIFAIITKKRRNLNLPTLA